MTATRVGLFLVGDAEGFVDQIFSVGVVLAMYSAYAARGRPGIPTQPNHLLSGS